MLARLTDPMVLPRPVSPAEARLSSSYDIVLQPVYTGAPGPDGSLSQVHLLTDKKCVWRPDLKVSLAMVSSSYTLVTPSQIWDMVEQVCRQLPGSVVVSAGCVEDGAKQVITIGLRTLELQKQEAQARLTLINSCDGSTALRIFPSIYTGHTEVVYADESKTEVAPMKHGATMVLDKLKGIASRMADSCVTRVEQLSALDKMLIPSIDTYSLFVRDAVLGVSLDDALNEVGAGKGFLDRIEATEAIAYARAEELGVAPLGLLNLALSYNTALDWEPFKSRGRSDLDAHWKRITGPIYTQKVKAVKMVQANAARLAS